MTATDASALERVSAAATMVIADCDHCGLPVPRGLIEAGAQRQFCCRGCFAAWGILHEHGLEQYYRMPERRSAAVAPSDRGFEEFDHPAFESLYVHRRDDGLLETDLYLEGVHCASCVWLVERVPLLLPGMARAELDVPRSRVRVSWNPDDMTLSGIARTLESLGYRPHPFRGARAAQQRAAEDRAMLGRIGVAGALAGNTMTVALALYAGWFSGMEGAYQQYFRWLSLLLTAPALIFPGRVFFQSAWAALRTRTLHMDVPIALALGAGFVRGAINTARGTGPIYFDGVAMLVFLLLVGRFLQSRAQRAAADSAELLYSLSPATARLIDSGRTREIPVEALLPGMTLEVRPGETLPADGVVVRGSSSLDVSLLSGESRPQRAAEGTPVYASTLNLSATLCVRVEQAGETSRLGRILREVEAGALRRAPVVRMTDRMSGAFVAVVLVLAAVTWWWWSSRDPSVAVDHAIALLIVTCPCALALATPLGVTVALGRAARAGILIKGGDALEALGRGGCMVLDKTGTLTRGRNLLASWDGPDEVRAWVLALERHAAHPVAAGFMAAWPALTVPEARDVRHTTGGGIEGEVEGRHVVVGSPAFVTARTACTTVDASARTGSPDAAAVHRTADVPINPAPPDDAISLTPVWVAVDRRIVAHAGFGDVIRPEAAATLASLRRHGWELELLSGDDPAVVTAVGDALGFPPAARRGGVSPEGKLALVEAAAARGPVVMVGDGVNDAAAIARATVGIGVRGGAAACLAAADVFLSRPGIDGLDALTLGARRTLGVIRRNIAFSLAYNVVGATLAMMGLIHPLLAALLMPASSLTVVLASWRSRTFDVPEPEPVASAPHFAQEHS